MVTAVAAGEVDIRAMYQSVQGSAHLTITAPTPIAFSVCGTVEEQESSTTLSGATVIITPRAPFSEVSTGPKIAGRVTPSRFYLT